MVASEIQAVRPRVAPMRGPASGVLIMGAISIVGLAAFLYPFLTSEAPLTPEVQAHTRDAPLIFGLLTLLAASLFVVELSSQGMNARVASILAVLSTCAAGLRLVPLPAGASGFFFLIILGGYVYGPRFGMLLGAMSMLVSAFVAGGLGPWLPYQMFASAWLGMVAGWIGFARPRLRIRPELEIVTLATFGALTGVLYGALMNIWFWPYIASGEEVSWAPGMGIVETVQHYWAFYVLTSFGWDAWAALGNAVLIVLAGRPVLRVLSRFHDRFMIAWHPQ